MSLGNRNVLVLISLGSLVILTCFPQKIIAQSDRAAYMAVYNICSPAAHNITRQQCHYGVVYEKYYQECMEEYGYQENTELDPANYQHYIKAHHYCGAQAENQTQTQCQYGQNYYKHYMRCMAKYGFDAQGELIGKGKEPVPEDNSEEETEGEGFEFNF